MTRALLLAAIPLSAALAAPAAAQPGFTLVLPEEATVAERAETAVSLTIAPDPGRRVSRKGPLRVRLAAEPAVQHLINLGVTAVELLPVHHHLDDRYLVDAGRVNYWGYNTLNFFAPQLSYDSPGNPLTPVQEFKMMVRTLHAAGIEVILDVVYNHTAEGNHQGPTLCYRGLGNGIYYILEQDRSRHANYTGAGNTLNANHPIVRRLIVDSLRYWVEVMHVDGFRFDLASILSRDEAKQPQANPPILWDIETDPVLTGTKLIAEAWDATGLYQVGTFVGAS